MNSSRAEVVFEFLGTNASTAIPELTRLMNNTNKPFASSRAVLALSYLGKDAITPLLQKLTGPDPECRNEIIGALGRMGYLGTNLTPAIPILIRYVHDPDPYIGRRAVSTLGRLGLELETIIPVLTNCLTPTNSYELREGALLGLGRLGERAKPAVPAIIQVLTNTNRSHSNRELRDYATNALMEIAPYLLTNVPAL